MGKGKELWDDSALVDAFDRALASFKEAHFEASVSAEDEKKTKDGVQDEEEHANNNISEGHIYQDDNQANKEEIQAEEPIKGDDVNSYDELLKQYYEIEEKRQTILQQLYTNPSYYNQTLQPDAYNATTPEHAVQNTQFLNPVCVGYCLPVPAVPMTGENSCGAWNPCFSTCQTCDKFAAKCAGCSVAVPCSPDLTKQSRDMDHSTDLKKGMMLAENAMRTINANISGNENETVGINECLQGISTSDADLVPVLTAWYSAGFHTGRYLLEKSRQNNS